MIWIGPITIWLGFLALAMKYPAVGLPIFAVLFYGYYIYKPKDKD